MNKKLNFFTRMSWFLDSRPLCLVGDEGGTKANLHFFLMAKVIVNLCSSWGVGGKERKDTKGACHVPNT